MDQNSLKNKTPQELLDICEDRDIFGMENQPADVLITVILNDMAEVDGIPTKADLMEKTVAELREILADREITGLDRQPKPLLVDILLNDYAKAVLSGVEAVVRVTKDEDGKVDSKITVSCGGAQNEFDVVGHTVGDVAELLKEILNIPANPIAVVNGNTVEYDYVLQDGDVLDFVQKAEKKG